MLVICIFTLLYIIHLYKVVQVFYMCLALYCLESMFTYYSVWFLILKTIVSVRFIIPMLQMKKHRLTLIKMLAKVHLDSKLKNLNLRLLISHSRLFLQNYHCCHLSVLAVTNNHDWDILCKLLKCQRNMSARTSAFQNCASGQKHNKTIH